MNNSTDTSNKRENHFCRSIFSRELGESGAALVMALLFLLIIALMVPAAMRMVSSDSARTTTYNESRRAFYIADAGIEVAKSLIRYSVYDDFLAGADEDPDTDADNGLLHAGTIPWGAAVSLTYDTAEDAWSVGAAGGSGNYTMINFNNGTFYARVMDNEDENPNDPNNDSDYILQVHVVGVTEDGEQSSIMAAYRKYDIPEDQFPGAVTMVGASATIDSSGTNMTVDGGVAGVGAWDLKGFDVAGGGPNSIPDPDPNCDAENAISVEAGSAIINFTNNAEDNFLGKTDSDPSNNNADIGYNQTDFTDDNSIDLRSEVIGYCEICVATGHTDSTGGPVIRTTDIGSLDEPIIAYFDGNVNVAAGVLGAGILVVDGDLGIVGNFDYAGIIIVGACPTCWGELVGVGNAKIFGAMVVGNSVDGAGAFTGSAHIYYSCQGVQKAVEVFSETFRTVGWDEND